MEENKVITILQNNYDYKIKSFEFLRDSGGTVYIVNGEYRKFLLKIAGKAFIDTFRKSVDIMCRLYDNNFPVPAVIKTKSGMSMLKISEDGQEYLFVLYEYIEGSELDLSICGEKVGSLIGQLHKLLFAYESELKKRDFQFFIKRYTDILHRKGYPYVSEYEKLGARLWERVKDCSAGVCHGDLHRGNLLETADGNIYLFDFDTVCTAPRMFDIMVMCDMTNYFNLQENDIKITKSVFENFLKGYTRHIDLTETELATFNDWVAIRHFQLQAAIVEIYGIDCIDNNFIDGQLKWIEKWCNQADE